VKNSPTLGTSNSYVASTLREDFQVLSVIYTPNTPVGCTNVNSIEINKCKGQLSFPLKTKSPSGATTGASPPPKKMVPFFRKKPRRRCTKYASTQVLVELTRDASGQRVKKREPGIAYPSSRIWPSPLATSPASHSWNETLPAKVHLRKSGGGIVQLPDEQTTALIRKHSNVLNHNCLLQRPHSSNANTENLKGTNAQ
jgi:hypothetical protein